MKNMAVLVLAAGNSSRMGEVKQLLKINGKTLLEIVLEKAKTLLNTNVFCVLGANATQIKAAVNHKGVQFIQNADFEKGLSTSIIAGINYFNNKQLNFDGILILLADQPAIENGYLKSLIDLFEKHTDSIIASKYGNKFGVPVVFPRKFFTELLCLQGDRGATIFINQRKKEVVYSKLSSNFIDIDTKEDVESFKIQLKKT